MASENVLKRAEDWLRTGANHSVVGLIHDLAAEVRELRKDRERLDWLLAAKRSYLFDPSKNDKRVGRYLVDREDIDAVMGGERTGGE